MKQERYPIIGEKGNAGSVSSVLLSELIRMSKVFRGAAYRNTFTPVPADEYRNDVLLLMDRYYEERMAEGARILHIRELPLYPAALFFCFCELFLTQPFNPVSPSDFKTTPSEETFDEGINPLLEKGFVISIAVNSSEDSKVLKDRYLLSPMACAKVFRGKDDLIRATTASQFGTLTHWKDIKARELFFPPELMESLDLITRLVSRDNQQRVQGALEERGLRSGLAFLFSGPPGTGKTEFIRQLALHEKRNLFLVDAARLDGSYYGEKPRNLRELFLFLRYMSSIMETAPFTFIDEADSLLGKRVELTKAVDKEENLGVNTILEEMNTFDGVLFAATNNISSLDPAIARRFVLKVEFPVPDTDIRAGIWKSKLPYLSDKEALTLATRFTFSGALIDNVVSLCVLQEILDGKEPSFERILRNCEAQTVGTESRGRRIGF